MALLWLFKNAFRVCISLYPSSRGPLNLESFRSIGFVICSDLRDHITREPGPLGLEILRSSKSSWTLGAEIPWNLRTLRLLAGRLCLGPLGLFFLDPGIVWGTDEFRTHMLFFKELVGEATTGTCWDFVFCRSISWPLSSSRAARCFCRKPLSYLEGAGMGENPSAKLCCFPRLEKQDIIGCSRTFALLLPAITTHSYLMSHTRFVFLWSYLFSLRVGQDRRSLGPDPALPLMEDSSFLLRSLAALRGRDHDRNLSRPPASVDFLVIGDPWPVFPGDEGSQHGHEMCSRIHPLERPDLKNFGLARRSPHGAHAPLFHLRDHRLIADEILGGLIYAGWRTGIFRDPCLLSRYRFGGPRVRPCEAVDIGPQGVLHMIRGPRHLNRPPFACLLDLWSLSSRDLRSLKEISSELTIRGRYEEEAIVRCTSSAVDRYRRVASTIENYDRSMYIMYHRSMSRHEMRDLVPADFKLKASPNYQIISDEFLI
ncbi:hypothetical protein DY000_02040722 [Brassica cretica]|uniref:Uncharacterized protein n=1 Tax=Brassica cretica TaxID=69181 RepID=A0ABQ7BL20_BRACR|nr:hypothetical protein DY000_02040722 [Brassica cretica]